MRLASQFKKRLSTIELINLTPAILAVVMFLLIIVFSPFDMVIFGDGYGYIKKAFEINEGFWTPIQSHSIGWSVFLGFFIKLFAIETIFEAMVLTRILSALMAAITLFPLWYLARKLMSATAALICQFGYAFSPILIAHSSEGFTESIFILLIILFINVIVKPKHHYRSLYYAAGLASLAYYVRPNGIFLLAALLVFAMFTLRPLKKEYKILIWILVVFIIISFPHLIPRAVTFGSPFDFGENSKYFAENYYHIWAPNIPVTSFFTYIQTHSFSEFINKFVIYGFLKVCLGTYKMLGTLWLIPTLIGLILMIRNYRDKGYMIILITGFIFLAGTSLVWDVFHTYRHVILFLPIAMMISALAYNHIIRTFEYGHILTISILFICLLQPVIIRHNEWNGLRFPVPKVENEWAIWCAENLHGNISIQDGSTLILMCLPNTVVGGGNLFLDAHDPISGISLQAPGHFENLSEALDDFRRRQINYILVNPVNIKNRPYLSQIYDPVWSQDVTLIKKFRGPKHETWWADQMDIFELRY